MSPEERFWSKVDKSGDCWLWTGALGRGGYGHFYWQGTNKRAHRVAYKFAVGPIPEGLYLDHLCRVRNCVNPSHLEPVTPGENTRRGETGHHMREKATRITHCPQGHAYDASNTRVRPGGKRECRACDRERWRRKHSRTMYNPEEG